MASPLVNVFQKRLTNRSISPELIVTISYLFFALLAVPLLILLKPFDLPQEFWLYIVLLGVLDLIGNIFLVKSLKTIDLSVFGPLNSYKPVVALLFGAVLLNEVPSVMGLLGVLVIICGSYFLDYKPGQKGIKIKISRGIVFRFLAILFTSMAAVFSKKTILLSSPLITLIYWSIIGWPLSLLVVTRLNPKWKEEVRSLKDHKVSVALLCLSFLGLQLFTLLTFERVMVGYSLALFQLSSVVSVFLGFHFFKEPNFRFRLLGAAVMVAGTMLIIFAG